MAAKKNKAPEVVEKICAEARSVHNRIKRKGKPQMRLPIRSLSNVRYHPRTGYLQLKGRSKVRTLTVPRRSRCSR